MYRTIVCLWNKRGELLFGSNFAPEVDAAKAIGRKFWSFSKHPAAARKRFQLALAGVHSEQLVQANFPGGAPVFYRQETFDVRGVRVVSVQHRQHASVTTLSDRELEILKLLPRYEAPTIVKQLKIARSTFDTHRRTLRKKLNCANNAELIAFSALYYREGGGA